MTDTIKCFWVEKNNDGEVEAGVTHKPLSQIISQEMESPAVEIQVELSSLNYKDALAATGNPGIVRKFPHIPGIDAVGSVIASESPDYQIGDKVIVTGNELGVTHFGGWAEQIKVPASWVVKLPSTMSPLHSMALGTAGFTAAQCVQALIAHEITPDRGSIIVTGATGGVASVAIDLLNKLGYKIVAVSGKKEQHDALLQRGVDAVIDRHDFIDESKRPLLSGSYAGAVDTVGGSTLATLLKSISYRGCVTACGLTGGSDLNTTVFPFLLRGVTLCGIDSAACPRPKRLQVWEKLSGPWLLEHVEKLAQVVPLEDASKWVDTILKGQVSGRIVVEI